MFYYHDAAADTAVPFDLSSDSNGFGIEIPRQKMGNKTTPLKAVLVILHIKYSDFLPSVCLLLSTYWPPRSKQADAI